MERLCLSVRGRRVEYVSFDGFILNRMRCGDAEVLGKFCWA